MKIADVMTKDVVTCKATDSLNDETQETQLPETDLVDFVRNSAALLKTLRDEIRVDLDLAGKEVRDRWRRLEARLRAAEIHARDTRQEAARDLATLLAAARQFRDRLRVKAREAQSGLDRRMS